jgi:hypothetical protein
MIKPVAVRTARFSSSARNAGLESVEVEVIRYRHRSDARYSLERPSAMIAEKIPDIPT